MKSPYVTIAHIAGMTGLTKSYISELAKNKRIEQKLINGFPLYCKLELGGSRNGIYLFMPQFADEVNRIKGTRQRK